MASLVEVNERSILIRVENRLLRHRKSRPFKRKEVRKFSRSSQRRLGRLLLNNLKRFKWFFTVTYRKNHRDCMVSKDHINNFLTRLRKAAKGEVGYVWVLEFQARGAVHFHVWLDRLPLHEFDAWKNLLVRKQMLKRFKEDKDGLERFRFLTYLWLRTTGQLGDEKAVKAATDLKSIYSQGFTAGYAVKYAIKSEQKEYLGNIDEKTGEVLSEWVGRYWGGSRNVRNVAHYATSNEAGVRLISTWWSRRLRERGYRICGNVRGLWFMSEREGERAKILCDDLDLHKVVRTSVHRRMGWKVERERLKEG